MILHCRKTLKWHTKHRLPEKGAPWSTLWKSSHRGMSQDLSVSRNSGLLKGGGQGRSDVRGLWIPRQHKHLTGGRSTSVWRWRPLMTWKWVIVRQVTGPSTFPLSNTGALHYWASPQENPAIDRTRRGEAVSQSDGQISRQRSGAPQNRQTEVNGHSLASGHAGVTQHAPEPIVHNEKLRLCIKKPKDNILKAR